MTAEWNYHFWGRLLTAALFILLGLYRIRHAGYYQRRAEARRLARDTGPKRYGFAMPVESQRGLGWWFVAVGLFWFMLAWMSR